MAISFSRPDPGSAAAVSGASFTVTRRGFDQNEVREFLRQISLELARVTEHERTLERDLQVALARPFVDFDHLDDAMLSDEAAVMVRRAREDAAQTRQRAEEEAVQIIAAAYDEVGRVRAAAEHETLRQREQVEVEAEATLEAARGRGREMVVEARAYRERVLTDLAARRELARQQVEQLLVGRDRLVQSFEVARLAAVDILDGLARTAPPAPEAGAAEETETTETPVDVFEPEPEPEVAVAPHEPVVEEDDRPRAPVVALFPEPDPTRSKRSVDDVFARLRAATTETVAHDVSMVEEPPASETVSAAETDQPATASPFARRAEGLTPLSGSLARRLKRVLVDEQNEMLHALGAAPQPVTALVVLVPDEVAHVERYWRVSAAECQAMAAAGAESLLASSVREGAVVADVDADVLVAVRERLAEDVVLPMRDRLERALTDADGDRDEIADFIRRSTREWRQRIDEVVDELARFAYGAGAYSVLPGGTPVSWVTDPEGPACPDSATNPPAGPVRAGEVFPSGHLHPPAGRACRCLLVRLSR